MQYIWEVVLAAEKNGIREADLQYEVPEVRSPYLEVSFYDLNTQTVEQTAVEVNPFYRFFDIFSGVLDINQKEYGKTKEIFVDAVFHYLALTDLRMGMSRKDYYFKFLVEELESGQFGRKAKALYSYFHPMKKNILYWRSWMSYLLVTIVRFSSGCFKRYIKTLLYIKAWIVPMNLYLRWKCRNAGRKEKGSIFIRHFFTDRSEDRSFLSGTFRNFGSRRNYDIR